ncbi:NAD(P)/FAD-dependent oxidoreductase [Pseudomonas sp. Marseille-QA0892]
MDQWRSVSLWMDQLSEPLAPRQALMSDIVVDVAIIGAGFTGLWTAYYLKRQSPSLNIAVLEAETAGFGASGRNGGWVMGNVLGEDRLLAGLDAAARDEAHNVLHGIPDEVGEAVAREGIDCHFRKGGVLYCAARYPEQREELLAQLAAARAKGLGEDDYRWLEPDELAAQLRVARPYGALYSPHCATIQPARLVRGLARCVEAMGVTIYERSAVIDWEPGRAVCANGTVSADWIVPAVEGYAAGLGDLGRHQIPVQSLIVATEPLSASIWGDIGLDRGQAFSEASRQVTYAQRSMDDRLVFGARGGYQYGGRLRTDFNLTQGERDLRRYLLSEMFPQLRSVELTHAWGGNLGMARRFKPHMLVDRQNRIALSGGYGGEGVGAANLGGRTLADLILEKETVLTRQPWVLGDRRIDSLSTWEPEPFRWLGYNAVIRSFILEDHVLANVRTAPWQRRWVRKLASAMEGLMR